MRCRRQHEEGRVPADTRVEAAPEIFALGQTPGAWPVADTPSEAVCRNSPSCIGQPTASMLAAETSRDGFEERGAPEPDPYASLRGEREPTSS